MKNAFLTALVALGLLALQPLAAHADMVPVGPADLTGSRSTPDASGIVAADGWTDANGGFKISWTIVDPQDSLSGHWEYSYTLSNADGSAPTIPGLSHWLLEVSPVITSDNVGGYIFDSDPAFIGPQTWSPPPPGKSNVNMPGDLYGIKFTPTDNTEESSYTFTFQSTQNPVWGDFYAKDGNQRQPDGSHIWATAWNSDFGTDPTSLTTDFTGWIPVPDTESTRIPEPSSLLLLVLGSSAVLGSKLRSRKK